MADGIQQRVVLFAFAIVALTAALVVTLLLRSGRDDETSGDAQPSESTHEETVVTYVGSAVCAECHADQHQSYLLTGHSRAMSLVDPASEPFDGSFEHALSGRRYEVYRDGGQLWHAESLAAGASAESAPATMEHPEVRVPLKYLVGSGRHSRTYLAELDGFLMESPITWYQSTQSWDMSPGYNVPQHVGFERGADVGCLVCHVGHIESPETSLNRLTFTEAAIGCERCHGPGSEHVVRWSSDDGHELPAAGDDTIVHPALLSRELRDAICAHCHLRGDATVARAGRMLTDFRPGEPLESCRIDYQLATSDGEMEVVGHVEQMRASPCYQNSDTMTCTTCHDPHEPAPESLTFTHYRNTCLSCHQAIDCGVDVANERRTTISDNCLACHMPQVPTDIPHIAFMHHRIGVHEPPDDEDPAIVEAGELTPIGDVSFLTPEEQQRCLALAYVELAGKQSSPELMRGYRERAIDLLVEVTRQGQADGDVYAALSRYAWEEQQIPVAMEYAQRAIGHPQLSMGERVNALFVWSDCQLQMGRFADAVPPLEELTRLRRHSEDWLLLGIALYETGSRDRGIEAVRQANRIQPFREDIVETLMRMLEERM